MLIRVSVLNNEKKLSINSVFNQEVKNKVSTFATALKARQKSLKQQTRFQKKIPIKSNIFLELIKKGFIFALAKKNT